VKKKKCERINPNERKAICKLEAGKWKMLINIFKEITKMKTKESWEQMNDALMKMKQKPMFLGDQELIYWNKSF
jgi:hypothetical protein